MNDIRYPIGAYTPPDVIDAALREQWIAEMEETPADLRGAVSGLSEKHLDEAYREGGWTIRQLVHHIPDSHLHGYIRFKWALTEDVPLIRPYNQDFWARTPEALYGPIEPSLALIDSLHARWILLLRSMRGEDFSRKLRHPESGVHDLNWVLGNYAWHGRHHVAQIIALRRRKGL